MKDAYPLTTYIGIDLAWSPRNSSGVAALVGTISGAQLVETALLGNNAALVEFVLRHAGDGPAVVAVDAPLWVPNQSGCRPAETALACVFRAYEAGAHPANRARLSFDGAVRGEALVDALRPHGFVYAPMIEPVAPPRQVAEVFPHPASVALFGLEKTLKYKARPGRSIATRQAAWHVYLQHLRALAVADPPLVGHAALLEQDVALLRGRALKGFEDRVDALLCAYIALYGQRWGAAHCRVFGDLESGAIFTPVPEAMREKGA